MRMSSVQGRPAIVPVNTTALPAGVKFINNIDVKLDLSRKGFTVVVEGEASNAAIKVSLGKPKVEGNLSMLNVTIELKSTGSKKVGAAVVSPFAVTAKVDQLADICVISIVNAKGEQVDSRILTLQTPPMQRGTRDV